jgi:hypothetical protein
MWYSIEECMKIKDPKWKEFEIAVTNFIKALDPSAKVTHDAMLPDKDTGTLRQRDVWIETKVSKHFSLQILVSCKRYKVKLNQQHIDAFIGELLSSGAQKGVIYSYSGFTKPALDKAKARGISCCRLYQNEPADIPEMLSFHAYLLTPAFHFWAAWLELIEGQPQILGELYELNMSTDDGASVKLIDLMIDKYIEKRALIRGNAQSTGELPEKWTDQIELKNPVTGINMLVIEFGGDWDIYEATLKGYLLNGSYAFTEKEFKGEQSFPKVDDTGPQPGEYWNKIDSLPAKPDVKLSIRVIYGNAEDVKKHLISNKGQTIQNLSGILKNA